MDNLELFQNMDSLEESHEQITQLIERLDRDSHIDSHEMGHLVTGMGGLLGQFTVNHHELQNEMKELLESSKSGLVSHEKLVELVHNEQIRSKFMNKLIDSLKVQIENLFNTFVNKEDTEEGEDEMMEKVANNVNLMWKSVNSLSTLIDSPAKKIDHTIRKIDSEVIVHLNQNNHGDRIFAEANREQFAEKIDSQIRSAKERRKNSHSPSRLPSQLTADNLDAPSHAELGISSKKNDSYGQSNKYSNNINSQASMKNRDSNINNQASNAQIPNNSSSSSMKSGSSIKLKSVSTEKTANSQNNSSENLKAIKESDASLNGDLNGSSRKSMADGRGSIINDNNEGINVANNNLDMNSSNNQRNSGEDLPDDDISMLSNASKASKASEPHSNSHRRGSKGSSAAVVGTNNGKSAKVDTTSSIKSGGNKSSSKHEHEEESDNFHADGSSHTKHGVPDNSTKSHGKHSSGESAKGHGNTSVSGKPAHEKHGNNSSRNNQKVIDDESSIESSFPIKAFASLPPDITEMMRILKDREAVLIKRETEIENEVKQRVKEYIRSHGIGYQKKSLSPSTSILDQKLADEAGPESGADQNNSASHPQGSHDIQFRDSLTNDYNGSSLLREPSMKRSMSSQQMRPHSHEDQRGELSPSRGSNSHSREGGRKNDQTSLEQAKFKELHDLKHKHGLGSSGGSRPNSKSTTRKATLRTITPLPRPIESTEVKARLDLDQNFPHLGTLHEIIDLIVNNVNLRYNGDLSSLDLIKIVTPKIPIKQDMATSTDDLDAKKPWELPIYHNNSNLLITRTYKMTPELESLMDKLAAADNPLQMLYDEFHYFLPAVEKDRLAFAAMNYPERKYQNAVTQGDAVPTSQDWFKINTNMYATMNDLFAACMNMLPMITAIEKIANEIIQFVKSMKKSGVVDIADIRSLMQNNSDNIKLLQSSLIDLYRLFGDLQAQEISNHLRLYEFRAFFERINVIGPFELKNLFVEFPDFKKCYQLFTSAQGQVYEVHRRLIECRDRCQKHEIFSLMLITQQQLSQQLSESMTGSHIIEEINSISIPPLVTPIKQHPPLIQTLGAIPSMQQGLSLMNPNSEFGNSEMMGPAQHAPGVDYNNMIGQLQEELLACHEEIEDLEMELLNVFKERDKTPGAILFFSLMHDPAFIPNLQQLALQFSQVKGFLDYTVEMDYVTLRKRLQVCLALMPTIDKLVEKYALLHKQWTHHRLNYFAERKLRGNAADNLGCCPLCYHDLDRTDGSKTVGKINKAISDAEEKSANKQYSKRDRTVRLPSSHQARKRMSATLSMLPNGQIGVNPALLNST